MEQKAISSDLIRGHIDTIILHTLISGDKHAQQISDFIDEKSDKKYQINQATLYSSLKRLESLKRVRSYWYDSDDGRRKFFSLTDSGRNSVEENLSSWAYSRAIIDKLMDCEPEPIYKTQYVEKIVEVKVPDLNSSISPILESNKVNLDTKIEENKSNISSKESETELNFRNVLNGLIKSTTVKHLNENIETVYDNNYVIEEEKIEKFNEKLDNTNNIEKTFNAGKIDLSELSLKASNEGYKLSISSKDSFINPGTLLINKLNLISSSIIFFIATALFFMLKASFNKFMQINTLTTLISLLCFVSFPLINAILYYLKPNKTTNKRIGADIILVALIVVFNLTLITFACNLIFNVDFTNFKVILISLIYPFILYSLIIIYFIVKYFIAKLNSVKLKTTKNAKTTAN